MTAENQDVELSQRETIDVETTVKDDIDGDPVDVTNAEITYVVVDGKKELIKKKTKDITHGGGTGELIIELESNDTDIDPDVYKHELRIDTASVSSPVMKGDFIVNRSHT